MDCLWDVSRRVKDVSEDFGRSNRKCEDAIYIDEENSKRIWFGVIEIKFAAILVQRLVGTGSTLKVLGVENSLTSRKSCIVQNKMEKPRCQNIFSEMILQESQMENGSIPFSILWLSVADYLTQSAVKVSKCVYSNVKQYKVEQSPGLVELMARTVSKNPSVFQFSVLSS